MAADGATVPMTEAMARVNMSVLGALRPVLSTSASKYRLAGVDPAAVGFHLDPALKVGNRLFNGRQIRAISPEIPGPVGLRASEDFLSGVFV
jgi:hypothetical protein